MKALFLIFHGFIPSNGISKKIHYQVKALKECGFDIGLCYYEVNTEGHRLWKVDDQVIADLGDGIVAKLKKRFDYSSIIDYVKSNHIDFIYMRSDHNANPFSINFIKAVKRFGTKIVMEIPTYPYDQEYVVWRMKMELFVDKLFRHQLAMALDGIVTFSDADFIFGKPTIKISNGIDFDSIPLKEHLNDTSKELHLIGLAEIHFWHGFDRLVRGLAQYYQSNPTYKVYFHVVGYFYSKGGREEFTRLIESYNLQSYVILYGARQGKELDELFDKADFAIGSLGRHRCGITSIKTLKNREYAARGFSFIYSESDSDFDNRPYVLKASADESPININSIITFYKSCKVMPSDIRASIRNLSWTNQMQIVKDIVIR